MVIQLTNQPASLARTAPARHHFSRPQFQGNCNSTANALVSDIKNLGLANRLYKFFGRIQYDPKIWGFSINDWASRINVALAVYAPALYFSIHPTKKHFWETNGRNLLIWLTTLGVTVMGKHPKYGVNAALNKLMAPKNRSLPEATTFKQKLSNGWQRVLNTMRPEYDYYDLLKTAGIDVSKEAIAKRENKWSGLDNNQIEQLNTFKAKLANGHRPSHLTQGEIDKFTVNATKLMNRLSTMKLVSFGLITAATIYMVGVLAMEVVFRYIAPLDPDFDTSKYKKQKDNPNPSPSSKVQSHPNFSTSNTTGTLNGIYPPQRPVSFYPAFHPPSPPGLGQPISQFQPGPLNPWAHGGNN